METIIGKEFPKKVIPLIQAAKSSIRICIFDWRWYPNDPGNPVQLFNHAIIQATRRGVKVEVVTNYDGVIRVLNDNGCDARKAITKNLIHAKMMIIDEKIIILGSHNYTQYAFTMNYEVSVINDDVNEIKRCTDFFYNLFNQYA